MDNKLKEFIRQWSNYEFSTGGMTGDDYLKFQAGFRRVLAGIAKQAGYQIHQFNKNHYCCPAVLKQTQTGAFAYLSISDVRFWPNQWYTSILYRQMRHQTDWTGRENHYCTLEELAGELSRLYT